MRQLSASIIYIFLSEKMLTVPHPAPFDKPGAKSYLVRAMRQKIIGWAFLFLVQSLFLVLSLRGLNPAQQSEPPKQQANDYMSNFLMRDTKPLGLKGDRRLEKLLKQPGIDWAIRAGARHILD